MLTFFNAQEHIRFLILSRAAGLIPPLSETLCFNSCLCLELLLVQTFTFLHMHKVLYKKHWRKGKIGRNRSSLKCNNNILPVYWNKCFDSKKRRVCRGQNVSFVSLPAKMSDLCSWKCCLFFFRHKQVKNTITEGSAIVLLIATECSF